MPVVEAKPRAVEPLWRIELLGGLRVVGAARVVTRFRTQRTGALLAYLAFHADRSHPRELLIETVWPEADPASGRNLLSTAISSLRRQLEPPGVPREAVLVADRSTVSLRVGACTVDARDFELLTQPPRSAQGEAPPRDARALEQAVTLYRGEFLPGFYDEWVLAVQQRLAAQFRGAVLRLIQLQERGGDPEAALATAVIGLTRDPTCEPLHLAAMRQQLALRRPDEARRQFDELTRVLQADLGVEPSATARTLAAGLRHHHPPSHTTPSPPAECSPIPSGPLALPEGTVTFLALEARGLDSSRRAAEEWRASLLPLVALHGGLLLPTTAGTLTAVFRGALEALRCGIACLAERDADTSFPGLGAGIHTAEAELRGETYRDGPAQTAARLAGAARAGQVLCTEATAMLTSPLTSGVAAVTSLGPYRLTAAATPLRLFRVDYSGMPDQARDLPAAEPTLSGHLPIRLTRFFGREHDLAHLETRLSPGGDGVRILTLTGPGGSGKTRLALTLAERLLETYQGSVWFASLGEVDSAAGLGEALLEALGVTRSAGVDQVTQTADILSRQPSLLILDNFEQLADCGSPVLERLLSAAPTLICLVTSRRNLGLAGEQEFPVSPLPVPRAGERWEELARCDSVRLFLDRAQAVLPDFQLTAKTAPAIAELCGQLDGIPLAIELAAARVKVLTPTQMVDQLDRRFDLLVSRRRDVAERHRTLWAAVDWSYRLLPPALREFFAALSVFRSGWTADAAAAVCGEALSPGSPGVLAALEELCSVSLVRAETTESGMRFSMLQTLRAFAAEQLIASRAEAFRTRHADHYLTVAEDWVRRLRTAGETRETDPVIAELDNVRQSLHWAEGQEDVERQALTALAAQALLFHRGFWTESRECLRRASARLEAGAPTADTSRLKAAVSLALGGLLLDLGDRAAAKAEAERALSAYRSMEDPAALSDSLNLAGLIALDAGDRDLAADHFREALDTRPAEDNAGRGKILHNLALAAEAAGDLTRAGELYAESLDARKRAGDRRGEAVTLGNLGVVAHTCGRLDEADALYRRSLRLRIALHDLLGVATMLNNLGEIYEARGGVSDAVRLFLHSERLYRSLHSRLAAAPAAGLDRLRPTVAAHTWQELLRATEAETWVALAGSMTES